MSGADDMGATRAAVRARIPAGYPVRPLAAGETAKDRVTCGTCGLSWDDAVVTSMTPAPSARCPFEALHTAGDPEPSGYSTAWQTTIAGFSIALAQRGPDDFRVTYGAEVDTRLTYARACAKLGQAVMHALACEDRIDNRQEDDIGEEDDISEHA